MVAKNKYGISELRRMRQPGVYSQLRKLCSYDQSTTLSKSIKIAEQKTRERAAGTKNYAAKPELKQ
jgi:hypothetical protein